MGNEADRAYYVDGCIIKRDHVYLASKLYKLDAAEHDFTRMCSYKAGTWYMHDLEWDVRSVCCWHGKKTTLCALSVQGDVSYVTSEGLSSERIPEAGAAEGLGAMRQIRVIGGTLYACGFHGQVYRKKGSRWVHADDGLLERDIENSELYLTSLDGTAEGDVYVVGLEGEIRHFDGKTWGQVKSPTKANLQRVRCVTTDEVYICGNDGALLRGNARDGFKLLSAEGESFWGIEMFQGKVYLAALSGLFVFEGDAVQQLTTGLDPEIDGYRLDAGDGVLWSFGVDDLAYFDGKKWTRVVDPDNV